MSYSESAAIRYARLIQQRHRTEIEAMSIIAAGPRQGMALCHEMGVTSDALVNVDAVAMWLVLAAAGRPEGPPWSGEQIVTLIRDLMQAVDLWDETDTRPYATTAMRWGPHGLARWATAVAYDPDLLRQKLAAIARIDREQQAMLSADRRVA